MKIIIDIGHPAHVHLFKYFAHEMQTRGHSIYFTARDKEFEIYLLKKESLPFISFGKHYNSRTGKIIGLLKFNFQLLLFSLKFKPDIFLSHGSIYASQVSWILRKPHISFEDTFNMEQIRLYKPFTDVILTGVYNHPSLGKKEIKINAYHENAYLHPKQFIKSGSVLTQIGLKEGEPYFILRFVSWTATHDIGHSGISLRMKNEIVKTISEYGRVFISSEKPLPKELEKYKIPIEPDQMHNAIANSSLLFGESATMASEAAVLGVPAIFLDNVGRYYTKEQEDRYGLVFNFSESEEDQQKALDKAVELLEQRKQTCWIKKQKNLLEEKIDLTAFLIWFIENYPESIKIMRENPDYQYKFRLSYPQLS